MDVVTLRTLTEKSTLGFGRFQHDTIEKLINCKRSSYLRWIYYNIEGITFTDSVLDKILIFKPIRIKKPGKDPNFHLWKQATLNNYLTKNHPEKHLKIWAHNTKEEKTKHKLRIKSMKLYTKKSVLRELNLQRYYR